jgi:hypothetical protein
MIILDPLGTENDLQDTAGVLGQFQQNFSFMQAG